MPRTDAQNKAAERDGRHCLWCKWRLSILRVASEVHHIFHRHPGTDIPEACVNLCHICHQAGYHSGKSPTRVELVLLMHEVYGYRLWELLPQFCPPIEVD